MKIKETLRQHRQKIQRARLEKLPTPPTDLTTHTCKNCGHHYAGRYCPQCSLPATWKRMTAKGLLMGFLDIWGLGNRPMFRTMGQLFLRPGYMIRDYLSGHHLRYFPPFKMLAILTILLAVVVWLRGATLQNVLWSPDLLSISSDANNNITRLYIAVMGYFRTHTLYRILLQNVFVVLAAWIVFRRHRLNLVETVFSQIYINCQMQLVAIAWVLLTGRISNADFLPYAVPDIVALLLLFYDFRQLYNLGIWATIWRMLLFLLLTTLIVLIVFFMFIVGLVVYQSSIA